MRSHIIKEHISPQADKNPPLRHTKYRFLTPDFVYIVGKEANANNQHFLLYSTMFCTD